VRVLVIGGGGREHALCLALSRDPAVEGLYAAPGNPGIAQVAECLGAGDPVDLAQRAEADLVVIGPEGPLVAGAADDLRAAGFTVFGPSRVAAQLEGSKAFAKDVMAAAGVPTAQHWVCTTAEELDRALDASGSPYVVKHDELAAGKGVVVTTDRAEAHAHATGHRVVVEAYLDGPEVSLFCVTDGTTVVPLLPAQDFKRIGDGDTGPNTGGMGAYAPLPWAPPDLAADVVERIAQPVVDELRDRGTPFAGLLYAGLALTSRGPMVIEFNARFGDPETQVVLPLLATPLSDVLVAAATESLAALPPLQWRDGAAVTVVIAAGGYPGTPTTGAAIDGIEAAEQAGPVKVVHAGTAVRGGVLVTAGGRVLAVTGKADDLESARAAAYAGAACIDFDGMQFRTDIARRAADGAITVPEPVGAR
jgi:phosphoribosylamine--glycine ligase